MGIRKIQSPSPNQLPFTLNALEEMAPSMEAAGLESFKAKEDRESASVKRDSLSLELVPSNSVARATRGNLAHHNTEAGSRWPW